MVSVLDKGEIMLMRSTINFPTLSLAAFGHMPLLIDRFESLPHNWQDGQAPHGHALGSGQAKPIFPNTFIPDSVQIANQTKPSSVPESCFTCIMGLVGAYDLGYYWNYQKLATCSPRPLGQTGQYVGRNKRA